MKRRIDITNYENRRNQICEQFDNACSETMRQITVLKNEFINEIGIKIGDMFRIEPHFQCFDEIKGKVLGYSVNDRFDIILTYNRVLRDGTLSIYPSTFVLINPNVIHKLEQQTDEVDEEVLEDRV